MRGKFFTGMFAKRNVARADYAVAVFDRIRRSEQTDKDVPPDAISACETVQAYLGECVNVQDVHLSLSEENTKALYLFNGGNYGYFMLGAVIALEGTIHCYLEENSREDNPYIEPMKHLQHVLQKIVAFSTEVRPDRIRKLIDALNELMAAPFPDNTAHDVRIRDVYAALYVTLALSDDILEEAESDRMMSLVTSAILCKPLQEIRTLISGEHGVMKEIILKDTILATRPEASTPDVASERGLDGPG